MKTRKTLFIAVASIAFFSTVADASPSHRTHYQRLQKLKQYTSETVGAHQAQASANTYEVRKRIGPLGKHHRLVVKTEKAATPADLEKVRVVSSR